MFRKIKRNSDKLVRFVAIFSLLINLSQPLLIVSAAEIANGETSDDEIVVEKEDINEEDTSSDEDEDEASDEGTETENTEDQDETVTEEEEELQGTSVLVEEPEEFTETDEEEVAPAENSVQEGAEEEVLPGEKQEDVVAEDNDADESLDSEEKDKIVEEKEDSDEKIINTICISDEVAIESASKEDWDIEGDFAETKNKVELGVRYEFPGNDEVSIKFNCLPEDDSYRSKLKIEQVDVDDLDLPEDYVTTSDYAYDITTNMEDGTFEYDLTLPKPEGSDAEVVYIEKSVEEAKDEVKNEDVKKVDEDKLDQKEDEKNVKVKKLDHFTIFYTIATYSDGAFTTSKTDYIQGETVFAKATRNYKADMRIRFLDPEGSVAKVCSPMDATEVTCEYDLPGDAPLGQWTAQIGRCNSGCGNLNNWEWSYLGRPYAESSFNVLPGICIPTQNTYEKTNDFSNSEVFINFANNDYRIYVSAQAGYKIDNVWLDVNDDGHRGYVWVSSGPLSNYNPDGGKIDKVKVEVTKVCPTICGNNILETGEMCDGTDLGGLPSSDFSCNVECGLELIDSKVSICHRTGSNSNPYVSNSPSKSGDVSGHDSHDGPIWYSGIATDWGDIIPPFYYIGGYYDGKNWTSEGQEIWNNDCEIPETTGSISGYKWHDLNGDGVWDEGEPGVNGVEVCLNTDGSTYVDYCNPGESTVVTGQGDWEDGYYEFTELTPDVYSVCEEIIGSAWADQSYPGYWGCHEVTVTAGQEASDNNFGNMKRGLITGYKWNDLNGNGIREDGEPDIRPGDLRYKVWQEYAPGMFSEVGSGPIYPSGYFEWPGLPGTYWISEYNSPTDWVQTYPAVGATENQFGDRLLGPIVITSDSETADNFLGNYNYSRIWGYKFEDLNGNGAWDDGEYGLPGWTIYLDLNANNNFDEGEPTAITDDSGMYEFTNLTRGQYHGGYAINELQQSGWAKTYPSGSHWAASTSGSDERRDFGNKRLSECGNGVVEDGEQCDHGVLNGQSSCSQTCQWDNSCRTEMVANGSFENPTVTDPIKWDIFTSAEVPGWSAEWYGGGGERPEAQIELHAGVNGWTTSNDQYVELDTDWDGPEGSINNEQASISLSQTIPTVVGNKYTLSWDYSPRPDHRNNWLGVYVNGSEEFNSGDVAGGSSVDWRTESYTFVATETATKITFIELGMPDSMGMFLDDVRVECLGSVTSVKICKQDTNSNNLSGWKVILRNESPVETVTVNPDGSAYNSNNLPEGDYALISRGTYEYRGSSGLLTDPAYSERLPADGYSGPYFPWINTMNLGTPGALGIMINDVATNWGNYLNDDHKYAVGFEDYSGIFKFSVYDNNYSDNVGNMSVDIYEGRVGVTGDDGCYTFEDVMEGDYVIEEINQHNWEPQGDPIRNVLINEENNTFLFTNKYVAPVTIVATKIVCSDEVDLPNWGPGGGSNISATTASNWVANHASCSFVPDWKFQWGYSDAPNPGDNTGESSDPRWFTTAPTDASGQVVVEVKDLKDVKNLWFREVWNSDYIPFTYSDANNNSNNFSAEIYCHTDVLNYDNWDRIDGPEYGGTYYCVAWNVKNGGTISGYKFSDTDGDGLWDVDESGLSGWEIVLDDATSVYTDANGYYEFSHVLPGTHTVAEVGQADWAQTFGDAPYEVEISVGQDITNLNFGNAPLGDIHGYKFWDKECEPAQIEGEGLLQAASLSVQLQPLCERDEKLGGWTIFIDEDENGQLDEGEPYTETESDEESEHFGWYWFEDLMPGNYRVCEVMQPGWEQTYPVEGDCWDVSLPESESREAWSENAVYAPEKNFGNRPLDVSLQISKENDTSGPEAPGGQVGFTMTVKALGGPVFGVSLTDLLPEGFVYSPFSWTASSSSRGDLKLAGVTTEPTYASPGTWDLGDMDENEVVTLTYNADILSTTDAGLYKDIAWARGENIVTDDVIAAAVSPGDLDDNFVGTDVAVEVDVEPDEDSADVSEDEIVEEVGEVLGSSTIRYLPATGSASGWLYFAMAALVFGLVSILLGVFLMRRQIKLKSLLVLAIFGVLFSSEVYAASSMTMRVEEPDTLINRPFDISFVVLDIKGRNIDAECYVKKPGETNFIQFGPTMALKTGGDSEVCSVDNSVLTFAGSYEFKIVATADDGTTLESAVISADYDSEGPERPRYIEADGKGSCKYEIELKTHASGDTAYVEIYADDDKEIDAKTSNKILTEIIGPDEKFEYDYEVYGSDCDKDWYFAVRAFDSAGNPSDLRVQELETKKTVTTTTTEDEVVSEDVVGALVVAGGDILGAQDSDENGSSVEGEVLGESVSADLQGTDEVQEVEEDSAGSNLRSKVIYWVIVILVVLFFANGIKKHLQKNRK